MAVDDLLRQPFLCRNPDGTFHTLPQRQQSAHRLRVERRTRLQHKTLRQGTTVASGRWCTRRPFIAAPSAAFLSLPIVFSLSLFGGIDPILRWWNKFAPQSAAK